MAGSIGASQMPPPQPHSGALPNPVSNSIPSSTTDSSTKSAATRRFYRRRSWGACEVCRGRRIRCDAMTLGVPCTNCTAFSIECTVLQGRAVKKSLKEEEEQKLGNDASERKKGSDLHPMQLLERQLMNDTTDLNLYAKFMDPEYRHAPIEAGKVGYVAENTNLALLVGEETVHYPIPGNIRDSRSKLVRLGEEEINLLRQRGALSLPHWTYCDDLIEAYFQYVAPAVPVVNRSRFMRQYHDPMNPPSLLLLQCIFLAGSKVLSKKYSKDTEEGRMPCAMTFYKRAKALYDSDYEDDRTIVLQALILLGWYGEENGDVTKNVFYWNGLATTVAQGSGVHRSTEKSRLCMSDKRLWKRIWWTLFTRDRSAAVAFRRPAHINTNDSDIEMICAEDFLEDEEGQQVDFRPNPIHVQFFIQYVSLCKVISLLLSQEHLTTSQIDEGDSENFRQCDRALVEWLQSCPKEVKWDQSRYNFWAAILHCAYCIIIGLRHRAYLLALPSEGELPGKGYFKRNTHDLPLAVYQAAYEITAAAQSMIHTGQIEYSPSIMIYALISALNTYAFQLDSENQSVNATSHKRIQTCLKGLNNLSTVWDAARVAHTRFQILFNGKGFQMNTLDEIETVVCRESVETSIIRSNTNIYQKATVPINKEPFPFQYRDRQGQLVFGPTAPIFPQNSSTASTLQFSSSSNMNSVDLTHPADYNTTELPQDMSYQPLQSIGMLQHTFFNPQIPNPDSYDDSSWHGIYETATQAGEQGLVSEFDTDRSMLSTFESLQNMPLQSMTQRATNSVDQEDLSHHSYGNDIQYGNAHVNPWKT